MKIYHESFKVKSEDCISQIEPNLPSLLGTYTLVKWMEIVSAKNINQYIDRNKYISVGKEVCIEHKNMATIDDEIEIKSTIISEEKRKILLEVEALCNQKTIATATHKRIKLPLKILEKML
jgi:predicted thioesterase